MSFKLFSGTARISALALMGTMFASALAEAPMIRGRQSDPVIDIESPPIQRCVNLGNALESNYEGEWGYVIQDRHIDDIAAAGFDTIRVPIKWSARAGKKPPYTINESLFERVDHVVDYAISKGLNVIIDVHHYEEIMKRPEQHVPRLAEIWRQIAERYQDRSDKLLFEILNEPHDSMTPQWLERANNMIMPIIRETNPERWVILSGADWGHLDDLQNMPSMPDDDRTMWSFHFYEPFGFTHQGATWTWQKYPTGVEWGTEEEKAEIDRLAAEAGAYMRKERKPLFLGEFGAYTKAPFDSRVEYLGHVRKAADREGIAWCHWDFAASFIIYDQHRYEWVPELKHALLGK